MLKRTYVFIVLKNGAGDRIVTIRLAPREHGVVIVKLAGQIESGGGDPGSVGHCSFDEWNSEACLAWRNDGRSVW